MATSGFRFGSRSISFGQEGPASIKGQLEQHTHRQTEQERERERERESERARERERDRERGREREREYTERRDRHQGMQPQRRAVPRSGFQAEGLGGP